MKIIESSRRIELSRRNLQSLLAKLDGNPAGSACTIEKMAEDGVFTWRVKAVEDSDHYSERPAGEVAPETARALPLTDDDIEALKTVVAGGVTRPAFYKDDFGLDRSACAALGVLLRHGVRVNQNNDTGKVTFS